MVYQLHIEENKSTYSYVCQKCAWLSVSIYLANRIVLVVTGHVPKADASINRAVHAVLVQTPIWLGLPPHKVSNRTKRVHPEPVTLPVNANFCANNICQQNIWSFLPRSVPPSHQAFLLSCPSMAKRAILKKSSCSSVKISIKVAFSTPWQYASASSMLYF